MLRYSLYIFAAIITFSISSLFAIDYSLLQIDGNSRAKTIPIIPKKSNKNQSISSNVKKEIMYDCKNKTIIALELFLKTTEFVNRVNSDDSLLKNDFPQAINCKDIYELKKVDLNKDGRKEILIEGSTFGLCNMRGNCEFWVFEKVGKKYKQILYHEWTFSYKISHRFTNGYANIEVYANSSNGNPSHYLHIHKFNHKSYKLKKCFSVYEFFYDDKSKNPKKVPEKCE